LISSKPYAYAFPPLVSASSLKIPGKNAPGFEKISGNSESLGLISYFFTLCYSNLFSRTSVCCINLSSIALFSASYSINALLSAMAY